MRMPGEHSGFLLSKSRFLAGRQCHKQLWWKVHEPDAPELAPSPDLQARFEAGKRVGTAARGYVPGGDLIGFRHFEFEPKIAATHAALSGTSPAIYEAALAADGAYAVLDILERGPRGFHLIEVKSSTDVKPEHIPDVGMQTYLARRNGIAVERAEVMYLNRECRYPDLSNLFVRRDVTPLVEGFLPGVAGEIAAQLAAIAGPIPVWNGCRPWDRVPVQFSVHIQRPGGGFAHHAWLAEGPGDPRAEQAERLVAACAGAQAIVAYNSSFERDCIRLLADAAPGLAQELGLLE